MIVVRIVTTMVFAVLGAIHMGKGVRSRQSGLFCQRKLTLAAAVPNHAINSIGSEDH